MVKLGSYKLSRGKKQKLHPLQVYAETTQKLLSGAGGAMLLDVFQFHSILTLTSVLH